MQVDFYQLAGTPIEEVVPQLAAKVLESGERLLLVCADETLRDILDQRLWDYEAASYLPHGSAGDTRETSQPILLSSEPQPVNKARFIMLADGQWRDEALDAERVFYLFDDSTLDQARNAWRSLAGRDATETRYWKRDGGRWREGP